LFFFEKEGYNVDSFTDYIEALNYFYQNIDNCFLVIADYKMPEMSRIDFIKKIRKLLLNINYNY
jgi:CheY-like chemotaxis protein